MLIRRLLTPSPAALLVVALASVVVVVAQVPYCVRHFSPGSAERRAYEVVIYGGTPSGVLAAVTASRGGASVVLLEQTGHLGGAIASGLTQTDLGNRATMGGYAREFFDRIHTYYRRDAIDTRWVYEAHVAERVFNDMIDSTAVAVVLDAGIKAVEESGTKILSVDTAAGHFRGDVFIDASYEGDLMALAGVSYRIGRESRAEFGETLAGVLSARALIEQPEGTSAYLTPSPGPTGSADDRVQSANFRMCFSMAPDRVPFTEPQGYDPGRYALTVRYLQSLEEAGTEPEMSMVLKLYPLVRGEFDVNNTGPFSTAIPGASWTLADATPAHRQAVEAWHASYDKGLVWFLASDPAVPASIRREMASYGWCADEWPDNDHFPWRLYVREGRRLVGEYVMKEADLDARATKASVVAIGSYRIDSHYISRWIEDGVVYAEGALFEPYREYMIPYEAILPRSPEATNLIVTTCLSSTHVAWAGLRMEPHLMMLGKAGGQAAVFAVQTGGAVQGIDVTALQRTLVGRGAVLALPPVTLSGPNQR